MLPGTYGVAKYNGICGHCRGKYRAGEQIVQSLVSMRPVHTRCVDGPQPEPAQETGKRQPVTEDGGATDVISVRVPASLKAQVTEAAKRAGVSMGAWARVAFENALDSQ